MSNAYMPITLDDIKRQDQQWLEKDKKDKYELELARGCLVADTYLTQTYLNKFTESSVLSVGRNVRDITRLRMMCINKIVFDPAEDSKDKLISVYSALYSSQSSVALFIRGKGKTVEFYISTRNETNPSLAGNLLEKSLSANFPGTDYKMLLSTEIESILNQTASVNKSLGVVSLIPSSRDEDKEKFVQGIEKFINGMQGKYYNAIFLATPVDSLVLEQRKHGYEELYSSLSSHSKLTLSYAQSKSSAVSKGLSTNFSKSINDSVSNTNGRSDSSSSGSNYGSNSGSSFSGDGWGFSSGSSSGSFNSYTTGSSFSHTISKSVTETKGDAITINKTDTTGITNTITLNFDNKGIQSLLEKTDRQLKRIELGMAYGAWETSCYFLSDDIATTAMASNMCKALFTGNESGVESAHINIWNMSRKAEIKKITEHICYLVHPTAEIPKYSGYNSQIVSPTNLLTGNELPIILGLPKKSVNGVSVIEMAEFGRSVVYEKLPKKTIEFGSIYHMGRIDGIDIKKSDDKGTRVPIDMNLLSSHCFITGSSGSGKSYATYELLDSLLSCGIKMLVIEPAKGEYKQVFGGYKGIKIYTTDPSVYRMLRVNPFQFPENLHILTHIEKLIQIFNASWSLYAAMPAILKDAVVKSYVKCGWDTDNSIWIEGISDHKYPTFKDVMEILPTIINSSDYSSDAKGDYKGALLTRVKSMTDGINGMIFEKSEGIKDSLLFDSNTVIDLSEIGSEETIALLMGVIIMKLGEYRQSVRKSKSSGTRDAEINHVTVLEEAHNLLKRTSKDQSQEGSNIVGKSVEMISNSIKEMRTYGEGFIIIDQSPMAVDTSAIENTSTKIIMNTPAKDACEELGSALALNEEQTKELSRLATGVAAVFQKGWLSPVLMKVDMWDDRYEAKPEQGNRADMRDVRSKLIIEMYYQSIKGNFSATKLKTIIRESAILREKKDELTEIVSRVNDMLEANGTIDKNSLGAFYLEFASCNRLFDVLKTEKIPNFNEMNDLYEPDGSCPQRIFNLICREGMSWFNSFQKALQQYINISNPIIAHNVIMYMLNGITEDGNLTDTSYSVIYTFMGMGYI